MSDATGSKVRTVYRNIGLTDITRYRLPPSGIVSILHRISGAVLFLVGIPVLLWSLQASLTSELGFERFQAFFDGFLVKLVLLGLLIAMIYHFAAGIRFLLLDLHIGVDKPAASRSAQIVLIATGVIAIVATLKMFGAF